MTAEERHLSARILGPILGAALVALTCLVGGARAQTVLNAPPSEIDTEASYVFYVHGRIIEQQGPKAVSPRFGAYQFFEITQRLAAPGRIVIAEVRGPGGLDYVETLTGHISRLLDAGVPARRISVIGFSKGGYVTLRAASRLQNPDLNYAILAGCTAGIVSGQDRSADGVQGRLFSMVDAADDLGFSCAPLFERTPHVEDTTDLVFRTGLAHGLFYTPDALWLAPLLEWLDAP
ncbi:hypothetical protein [Aestuariivita sp.]|jgi:hypothetical protein|uniref:hypothetical protein n=1 Tax=Aestuariivita sp. TaxID=1872407 RepID=UPI0021719886|nr:hypothetical protein [Aestuariivita sp.]MCE8006843.1 hypothetical protein [Aestuariivita sp.]